MSDYTYLAVDLRTNAVLNELPLAGVSFSDRLDGAGKMSASLPLGDPRVTKLDPVTVSEPKRTALFVDRDGTLVWGGIIWTRKYNTDSEAFDLSIDGFWSYFSRRTIRSAQGMLNAAGGSSLYLPTSDSQSTEVVGTDNENLWENVNDYPTDDGVSNIVNTSIFFSYLARFTGEDLAGVTIHWITLTIEAYKVAGNAVLAHRLRINGNNHDGPTRGLFTVPFKFQHTFFTNPDTGLPWTEEDVEGLDGAGFVGANNIANPSVAVNNMGLTIAWSPVSGGRIDFAQVDQFDIARDFVRHAQSFTGGDIGVTLDSDLSGVPRDRHYFGFELKNLGDAFEELSNVLGGFDFGIDVFYEPTTHQPVKRLNLSYPRRGRPASQTGLLFELPGNISSYDWPEDATRSANVMHAVGAGDGDEVLRSTAVDTTQIDAGYPLLEDVQTFRDVSVQQTLDAHAQAELAAFTKTVTLPTLTVRADMDPPYGSYITGDDARIRIKDARFPDGIDVTRRIIDINVTVGDDGKEAVKLTLGEV